ncbi:hypothetical protein IEQ34_019497 [Dendrobium chrysotoxum]|uniref:Secreted protein n=1 Tax=Dendrobium chrysotoxum TaxID=161865 RepID=A0AAV7G8P9_DENCH|nr:hypothetical protein IEQ34_019497 [Dendrobium chrysotoxum]
MLSLPNLRAHTSCCVLSLTPCLTTRSHTRFALANVNVSSWVNPVYLTIYIPPRRSCRLQQHKDKRLPKRNPLALHCIRCSVQCHSQ